MTNKHLKLFIEGIVQGVGFRPHVYNMAKSFGLKGYVLNDARGVTIEGEAAPETLEQFAETLKNNPPPLAQIQRITEEWSDNLRDYSDFTIKKSSDTGSKSVLISPDIATCRDCIEEMKDPGDRRYGYAFINCTNCGPRFTIITDVPYDRHNTSMADFPMCDFCKSQYEDPSNRRFHAQPVACPVCGPQIRLLDNKGNLIEYEVPGISQKSFVSLRAERSNLYTGTETHEIASSQAPRNDKMQNSRKDISTRVIQTVTQLLKQDKIIAIKGLGGYHLAADAKNEEAVAELRKRKYREDKPFAVMYPDIESAEKDCHINPEEERLLKSHQSPIILLKKRENIGIAPSVAPDNNYLGVMLPYTPLHHLIMNEFPGPLVMTSGNVSEEPISYIDGEARERLNKIADFFLIHNRPIHTRCDDTVTRIFRGKEYPLRRSRGYAPNPLILKKTNGTPILAVGGELKNTFCILKDNKAFLSHHIGDLENIETLGSFEEGINHFKRLFDAEPEIIAHDAHPRYLSTQFALDSPIKNKIAVQHHYAHIVSCMADNGIEGEVIGIALDGVGYGLDGKLWGCEFMTANEREFNRRIHLKYVKLAGGEKAIREPWRIAFAYLYQIFGEDIHNIYLDFLKDIDINKINFIIRMLDKKIGSPEISSAGRLFDAVSSLIGIRSFCNFEGQAAIGMEMTASGNETAEYPVKIVEGNCMDSPAVIDPDPIFLAIINDMQKGIDIPAIAGRFHNTMARIVLEGAKMVSRETGLKRVVLSGGVFQNILLLEKSLVLLENNGFEPYIHHRVPTNDGGISLGQAVSAKSRIRNFS